MNQDIVHAHSDQVYAHRVVHIPLECQFELGAHAVSTADQNGLAVVLGDLKHRTEPTDTCHHTRPHGFFCERLDAFNQGVASLNIDTSRFIGKGSLAHGMEWVVQGCLRTDRIKGLAPDKIRSTQSTDIV